AVHARVQKLEADGEHINVAIAQASEDILAKAQQHIAMPKRFSVPMREIWALQPRFDMRRGGRAQRLLTHPRFRAAYDFLLLRAASGELPQELADWWTQAQTGSGLPPLGAAVETDETGAPRKRRRRRGGRNRRRPDEQPTPTAGE
ncbi:MAG: polynucleotide adenylyltransferase PcnB, partial [Solimonas sp.]